ncbi:MAG: hypothetical protein L6Q47_14010 [Ignavibacteriaceae bacterium]|nr:hypothetical protein [Ignavibacteriaceae bacterium]
MMMKDPAAFLPVLIALLSILRPAELTVRYGGKIPLMAAGSFSFFFY